VKWDQTAAILKDGYLMSAPKKVRDKTPGTLGDPVTSAQLTPQRISRTARRRKAPSQVR